MQAFIFDRYGKQAALRLADMPQPELRDDEVLVQVHAAGVNLLDAKIRNGEFKPILPYRLPLVPPSAAARDRIITVLQDLKLLGSAVRL